MSVSNLIEKKNSLLESRREFQGFLIASLQSFIATDECKLKE
jgi:hypothetical protein